MTCESSDKAFSVSGATLSRKMQEEVGGEVDSISERGDISGP